MRTPKLRIKSWVDR